jgi:hypothetical protein
MNDENGRRPVPSRVVNLKDVKRSSERNARNPTPNVTPAINNRQKVQPARPTNVTPATNNRQKVQPARSVNPRNKVQPQRPRMVNPLKENRMAQPKTDKDENGKR